MIVIVLDTCSGRSIHVCDALRSPRLSLSFGERRDRDRSISSREIAFRRVESCVYPALRFSKQIGSGNPWESRSANLYALSPWRSVDSMDAVSLRFRIFKRYYLLVFKLSVTTFIRIYSERFVLGNFVSRTG